MNTSLTTTILLNGRLNQRQTAFLYEYDSQTYTDKQIHAELARVYPELHWDWTVLDGEVVVFKHHWRR